MTANYTEISEAREALRDSYQNLQNLANYCEKNYMEAPDKRKALESTMALVTQTLASVASQVGIAARHVSNMLEEQSEILEKEEAKVRFMSLLLDIHAEKVSRRKIGTLTHSKKYRYSEKILYGETNGPLASYIRHPINLCSLDATGHGMMDTDTQQLSKTGTMSRKISVKSMSQIHSSLGRSCRIKDPVPLPLVPEMAPCPLTPNKTSSRDPHFPRLHSDFPLPPPAAGHSDPDIEEKQTIVPGSDPSSLNFADFPPPPDFHINEPFRIPLPDIDESLFTHCMSTENTDDPLPPPPTFEAAVEDSYWPPNDAFQLSSCTSEQYMDDFFPPPPPTLDINNLY